MTRSPPKRHMSTGYGGDHAVSDRFGELGSARRGAQVVWDRVGVTSPHEIYSFATHVERRIVTAWADVNDPSHQYFSMLGRRA